MAIVASLRKTFPSRWLTSRLIPPPYLLPWFVIYLYGQVVLAPVILGAFLNQQFPRTVARAARFSPCLATLLIALIVGSTLGHSAEAAKRCGLHLFAAVFTLHGAGGMGEGRGSLSLWWSPPGNPPSRICTCFSRRSSSSARCYHPPLLIADV